MSRSLLQQVFTLFTNRPVLLVENGYFWGRDPPRTGKNWPKKAGKYGFNPQKMRLYANSVVIEVVLYLRFMSF